MPKKKGRREPRAAAYFFRILDSLDGLADAVGRVEVNTERRGRMRTRGRRSASGGFYLMAPVGYPFLSAASRGTRSELAGRCQGAWGHRAGLRESWFHGWPLPRTRGSLRGRDGSLRPKARMSLILAQRFARLPRAERPLARSPARREWAATARRSGPGNLNQLSASMHP